MNADAADLINRLLAPMQFREVDGVTIGMHPHGPVDDLLEEAALALLRLEAARISLVSHFEALAILTDSCGAPNAATLIAACLHARDRSAEIAAEAVGKFNAARAG